MNKWWRPRLPVGLQYGTLCIYRHPVSLYFIQSSRGFSRGAFSKPIMWDSSQFSRFTIFPQLTNRSLSLSLFVFITICHKIIRLYPLITSFKIHKTLLSFIPLHLHTTIYSEKHYVSMQHHCRGYKSQVCSNCDVAAIYKLKSLTKQSFSFMESCSLSEKTVQGRRMLSTAHTVKPT